MIDSSTHLRAEAATNLRRLGFRKLGGSTYLREAGETWHVSLLSVSRFEPLLMVDVGVLIPEQWAHRLPEAAGNPIGWDLNARVEHVADLGVLADALDLAKPVPDRIADLARIFDLAESRFWKPYSILEAMRVYAFDEILPPGAWSAWGAPRWTGRLLRHFTE